jgi:hypothetical protein
MRDFDLVKSNCPPLNVVPGTLDADGNLVGSGSIGTDYTINQSGWHCVLNDPGPLSGFQTTPSSIVASPYYELEASHRSHVVWTPFARMDKALVPLGQTVADGKSFEAFHSAFPGASILRISGGGASETATFPAWSGVVCRVVDIWSSEEITDLEASNMFGNGLMPGSQPAYPLDTFSGLNMPINNPSGIPFKLRSDQIISATYREMISSTNAPSAQYFGGQLMTVNESTIGGNASISEKIHHLRYVRFVASNDGTNNLADPSVSATRYNYAKAGFFVPASVDTLTIGIGDIKNDAEWATIARRGASR